MSQSNFKVVALVCSYSVALLGVLVLIGWYSHIEELIQVVPTFVPMQYNTALGFILAGLGSLFCLYGLRRWALVCGTLVALLGLLTGVQYIFGVNLHIDEFFMEHYVITKTSTPGRMAPNTALCFLISGITVSLISSWKRQSKANSTIYMLLVVCLMVFAIIPLFGYVFSIERAYGWSNLTRMAVHTSFGFLILAVGFSLMSNFLGFIDRSARAFIYSIPIGLLLFTALMASIYEKGNAVPYVIVIVYGVFCGTALIVAFSQSRKAKQASALLAQQLVEANLLRHAASFSMEDFSSQEIYEKMLSVICLALNWPVGHAYIFEEKGAEKPEARSLWSPFDLIHYQEFKDQLDSMRSDPWKEDLSRRVLDSHEPQWFEVAQDHPHSPLTQACRKAGLNSGFAFPLEHKGKRLGLFEFFTDKSLQADAKLLKRMEHVGAQISSAIVRQQTNEELVRAKNIALKSLQAKATFLAMMSHDLRTPLNVINGIAEVLQGLPLGEEELNLLKILKKNGTKLVDLVSDIIDMSIIDSGKMVLRTSTFNLHQLLSELQVEYLELARQKGLEFSMTYDEHVPENIECDLDRLRQVLVNLLGNGIKYTEKGHIALKVTSENNALVFLVKDTGIGISKSEQNKIMLPFVQAGVFETRAYEGTGLGLTISKYLIELMGGKLRIESDEGVGSSFSFSIPCVEKKIERAVLTRDVGAPYTFPKRVLIVEDNFDNAVIIQHFLQDYSSEVDLAENGKVAVNKVKIHDYDLILMDILMPEMDGYDATRAIRKLEETYTPIIMLTAFATNEAVLKSREAGSDAFLIKPVNRKKLLEKIEEIVQNLQK